MVWDVAGHFLILIFVAWIDASCICARFQSWAVKVIWNGKKPCWRILTSASIIWMARSSAKCGWKPLAFALFLELWCFAWGCLFGRQELLYPLGIIDFQTCFVWNNLSAEKCFHVFAVAYRQRFAILACQISCVCGEAVLYHLKSRHNSKIIKFTKTAKEVLVALENQYQNRNDEILETK